MGIRDDGVSRLKCVTGERGEGLMYRKFFKRAIDLFLSFIGIVVLIPVWLILPLAIYINDPGPIFFVQKRYGRGKKPFKILKFRTMKASAPHEVATRELDHPEQYITKFGEFLRKTSLDELPQLFNIFFGKMSIIGPRPVILEETDLIAERDKYGANDVRPGLTGWAQINGRDEVSVESKAKLDGEYVEKMSLGFDLKCFIGTIKVVLTHDGVVEGSAVKLHNVESEIGQNAEQEVAATFDDDSEIAASSIIPDDTDGGYDNRDGEYAVKTR